MLASGFPFFETSRKLVESGIFRSHLEQGTVLTPEAVPGYASSEPVRESTIVLRELLLTTLFPSAGHHNLQALL